MFRTTFEEFGMRPEECGEAEVPRDSARVWESKFKVCLPLTHHLSEDQPRGPCRTRLDPMFVSCAL
jgi:hypothetical protein